MISHVFCRQCLNQATKMLLSKKNNTVLLIYLGVTRQKQHKQINCLK